MNTVYTSPALKVIIFENNEALCATSASETEKFTLSSYSYTDDDFE